MVRFFRFLRSIGGCLKLGAGITLGVVELALKRPKTRRQRAQWLHHFCQRLLQRMGIVARYEGAFPSSGFVVSNHLGYLDIVAFAALHPCIFVAKSEIGTWPILGWMTTMSGTVYVERGRGGSAQRAMNGIEDAAEAGLPVVFFPEGTTTNGSTMLKFRSGLLSQARESGQTVTAAHVRYSLTRDNGPGVSVEDTVSYWDDTPILKHMFRLVGLRGIEIDVRLGDSPIPFSAHAEDRTVAATEARNAVMELGGVRYPVEAT